ncbi:uncharacterized protein MELLADRAFT_85761 [Melampsora larici-populina 98AG31]|uniref:Uncharacterized protein n=1 Tax=Melampsora larici-populina (strain 98AG31 / pathotype 3-4-7) TaxID=747676 RepID=F4RJP1_MELLP|nr:uncharacterized protein MELLADRAFT_85761 [Melampsora larici-populina 98AG31]EGG07343.1 hypothetical protein MELLADRAFT_85761 [Melampsora larici-populina 98AG31]
MRAGTIGGPYAIDAHSGYDFPWSLHHIIPFWAGADHDYYQHEKFMGSYYTSFCWTDAMIGIDKGYKAYHKKEEINRERVKVDSKKVE